MKKHLLSRSILFLLLILVLVSCDTKNEKQNNVNVDQKSENEALGALQTLLKSIENRDLESLKTTMSPTGEMELIIPGRAITYTADEFVELHKNWFKDTIWTVKTNILDIKVDHNLGYATTDAMYKEPERDGKPYFNHLIVSYVLEKINDKWYVVKDHACSLKKSTD